jgi:hypothetical protein
MIEPHALWQQPGWLGEIHEWIGVELARHNLTLKGELAQVHLRPWATVFRVPTVGGDYYFKAVIPELDQEAAVTQALARWRPDDIVTVLAADHGRGWLLMADGGIQLRQSITSLEPWQVILPQYANLQIGLYGRQADLLRCGLPDRRLSLLPVLFEELINQTSLTAVGQPHGLTTAEHQLLQAARPLFIDLCDELAASKVVESLDHGDLHDGNIFVHNERYLFFDWGDSSVTFPFFSLRTIFVSIENRFGLEEDAPEFEWLRDCYLEPWTRFDSLNRLRATAAVAQRVAPIIAGLRWASGLSRLDELARREYAHIIPSLLREFLHSNG